MAESEERKRILRERSAIWRKKNPERWKEIQNRFKESGYYAKWYQENKDRLKKLSSSWAKRNPERKRMAHSKWAKRNPSKMAAKNAKRIACFLRATPAWANDFFIDEIYDLAARRTKLQTGGHAKWNVDHIVPLQSTIVCGLHVEHNLQVIPGSINQSKNNRHWPDMP